MRPAEHDQTHQPNLKAYLDNELSLWRRFAVRLHLARCASCQEEMRAMQQIGNELRGQTKIDPLDPGLRSRILATVREMTPAPTAPVYARRPILVWGGSVFAALLLIAVFASRSQFAPSFQMTKGSVEANSPSATASAPPASLPGAMDKSAGESSTLAPTAPAHSQANFGSSVSGATVSKPKRPQLEEPKTERRIASADESPSQPQDSAARAMSGSQSIAGDRLDDQAKSVAAPKPSSSAPVGTPLSYDRSKVSEHTKARREVVVGSVRPSPIQVDGLAVNRLRSPQETVALERAGFDLNGYQFVTQGGERIAVPFHKSLNAVRFARATDGKMALTESASSPILYLSPADTLVNAAVPGARWQPLPPGYSSMQPLYVRPAQDWDQFTAMRWYPNMTFVGGLASADAATPSFPWLPGSHVQIGATFYPDLAAYRAFADAHPEALRLHAVYDSILTPPALAPAAKRTGSAASKSHR